MPEHYLVDNDPPVWPAHSGLIFTLGAAGWIASFAAARWVRRLFRT